MPERYPDDAALLTPTQDDATGVEYIPTGRSPYYLEFRKLVQRLLRVAERANDLRPYRDGDLSIGVRAGRCTIGNNQFDFAGAQGVAVTANATTHVWLDGAGALQTGTAGLPADRTTFIPIAEVVAGLAAIDTLTDLRGEALLTASSTAALGLTATAAEINQALAGIDPTVTALALSFLCNGPASIADALHGHTQFTQDVDGEAVLRLINASSHADANTGLRLSLPNVLAADNTLHVSRDTGFLRQRYNGVTYDLVGAVHAQYRHDGGLLASQTDRLIGVVPIDGAVTDVILSLASNLQSSVGGDGVGAAAKVNGNALTDTDPQLTSDDGAGFVSTAQGDGTAAIVKTTGVEQVQRGDVLTVDLARTANGTITTEAKHATVLVVIRATKPE